MVLGKVHSWKTPEASLEKVEGDMPYKLVKSSAILLCM